MQNYTNLVFCFTLTLPSMLEVTSSSFLLAFSLLQVAPAHHNGALPRRWWQGLCCHVFNQVVPVPILSQCSCKWGQPFRGCPVPGAQGNFLQDDILSSLYPMQVGWQNNNQHSGHLQYVQYSILIFLKANLQCVKLCDLTLESESRHQQCSCMQYKLSPRYSRSPYTQSTLEVPTIASYQQVTKFYSTTGTL